VAGIIGIVTEIDFGAVKLSAREKAFYRELNNEILLLCKSLPESTHTDALMFFVRYSGISFGDGFNFFKNYHAPIWSIIYWLVQSDHVDKGLEQEDIKNAKTAHAMAMFLHSLDDHLNDNDIPATHLALLLRGQSWMIMNNALTSLADGVNGGEEIVRGFLDDYYSSIRSSKEIESLDSYCNLFRKQMATGLIAPVLLTKKMTSPEKFTRDIQAAYGSFGIAWRLLDDIKDIETDMMKGTHSCIYICLPEKIKNDWDKLTGEESNKESGYFKIVLDFLMENRVIDRIKERICSELEFAASIADDYSVTGLADEFCCLVRPLWNTQNPL